MFRRDRRGRLRRPEQERGLRPLFPRLDEGWESRALRVAMPGGVWRLFDQLVSLFPSPTLPRAYGEAITYLLGRERRSAARWMDWEKEKQLRLLRLKPQGEPLRDNDFEV